MGLHNIVTRLKLDSLFSFDSYKFGKKLVYINRLAELDSVLYTDQMDVPEEVMK